LRVALSVMGCVRRRAILSKCASSHVTRLGTCQQYVLDSRSPDPHDVPRIQHVREITLGEQWIHAPQGNNIAVTIQSD
jgi:hypothetical protein